MKIENDGYLVKHQIRTPPKGPVKISRGGRVNGDLIGLIDVLVVVSKMVILVVVLVLMLVLVLVL